MYPGAQWHRCLGLDGGHTDTHSASWLQGRPEQGWAAQLPSPCREVTRGSAGDRRLMRVLCRYVDNIYRVFSKGRNEVGPSKSLIFWTFSDVLGIFRPFNMGDFSFWYFWDI